MMFMVALRKELLELRRTHRLLVISIVFVFLGLLSPLGAKLIPELIKLVPEGELIAEIIPAPTIADAMVQYNKNISQFGVVLALLMTMGTVAQEKDKGTAALVLSKPMPRAAFLSAKFVALGLAFMMGLVFSGVAAYYYTMLLFEPPAIGSWLALNGLMLLFLLVFVALTLLCSVVSRSLIVAGGLGFGAMVVVSLLGMLPVVGEYLPGQLIKWGLGLNMGAAEASWPAVWVSLAIIMVSLFAAWVIFRNQEL